MMTTTQHMWGGEEFGWHFFGLMGPLLFLILALSLLSFMFWAFRSFLSGSDETYAKQSAKTASEATSPQTSVQNSTHASALVILAERFARGEIDKTQYEDMRRTLTS